MRNNQPITTLETKVAEGQYLISKTDLKGRIVYANPAFIEISGFSRSELIGKAHNIVRHPHMPPSVFKDFWETLQAGHPWTGVVKNRRKDGGYYWVYALASPIHEGDKITGYASVRVRPSDNEIAAAEALYQKINTNQLKGYEIKQGKAVPTGWRKALHWLATPFRRHLFARLSRFLTISLLSTIGLSYLSISPDIELSELGRFGLGAAWLVLVVSLFVYIRRLVNSVSKPITQAALIAQQIAAGNLLVDIRNQSKKTNSPELRHLYFCLDIMRQGLTAIANDTQTSIRSSQQVTQTIHADNQLLAERTQHQAASLQQTAASMEELTVTVQQNADNTREATKLAHHSMSTAQHGGVAVNQMVDTIQDIQQSSRQIAEIVTLIESIAFQTNILALNAAVESARAGESGRGFAVVAGEVRHLAQRSAQAAGEIKTLIEQSVAKVENGAQQAKHAGATMSDIVQSVQQVNHIISEIAMASDEQAAGLLQIHSSVADIDEITQQNTSLAHNLSGTVRELTIQTKILEEAIRVLNVGKG